MNQERIADINFDQVLVGEHTCNVNRKKDENLYLLTNFQDISPQYNKEYGPHLKIHSKKNADPMIIVLNNNVCNNMIIPNSNKMNDDEFYPAFIEKKKLFVDEWIIRQTYARGFEEPSEIQSLAIPELIQGRDVLTQFKAGTGKTWAFLVGLLWGFDPSDQQLQYIFITNSHEIAKQMYEQVVSILPEKTNVYLCIGKGNKRETDASTSGSFRPTAGNFGGKNRINNDRDEVGRAQVIVSTMGKLFDFMCTKKWIRTKYVKAICVDEFDNIVTSNKSRQKAGNTAEQMSIIIQEIPAHAQRAFFSATITHDALDVAYNYFRPYSLSIGEPFLVLLDIEDYTLKTVQQYYVECATYQIKKEVLIDLLQQCRITQGIIFTNRIETAKDVKNLMDEQVVPISSAIFHSGLPNTTRDTIHKDFAAGKIRLLISTDLTSRGLDVHQINVVINFDMPDIFETYVHRVGRAGRYNRRGVAISLLEVNKMKDENSKVAKINEASKYRKMAPLPQDLSNLL